MATWSTVEPNIGLLLPEPPSSQPGVRAMRPYKAFLLLCQQKTGKLREERSWFAHRPPCVPAALAGKRSPDAPSFNPLFIGALLCDAGSGRSQTTWRGNVSIPSSSGHFSATWTLKATTLRTSSTRFNPLFLGALLCDSRDILPARF